LDTRLTGLFGRFHCSLLHLPESKLAAPSVGANNRRAVGDKHEMESVGDASSEMNKLFKLPMKKVPDSFSQE
jgi:hypothetical protein